MKKKQTSANQPTKTYNLFISYLCACCAKLLNDEQKAARINIGTNKGNQTYTANHIIAVRANGSSADFYVLQPHSDIKMKTITASFPLKSFDLNYLHPGIVRVHDSWMVNLSYVYEVHKNGDLKVHYLEKTDITLSPTYRKTALAEMKKRGFMVYE